VTTTILLARHGETDWNRDGRVQGHTDTPLNETGRAQARALAAELADEPIDAVYSSDLLRAHETARVVAGSHQLDVTSTRDLRERHFGTWEGMTDDEVLARFPQAASGPWGDAETVDEMTQRVLAAVYRIAEAHPGGTVLAVSHGGPLRAVSWHARGPDIDSVPNCHVMRFAVEGREIRPID
jgi:2,3-bisphosphoglycerate-dependent phosphoglycerate mutase